MSAGKGSGDYKGIEVFGDDLRTHKIKARLPGVVAVGLPSFMRIIVG